MKSYNLKYTEKNIEIQCPICDQTTYSPIEYKEMAKNCSADCCKCGELLLIENEVVYPFHQKLNSEDKRWPKDGAGTGVVEIQPMPKVIGHAKQLKKKVTCQSCTAIIEYIPKEVKTQQYKDYDGGSDSYNYIICPECKIRVEVK